MEQIVNLGRLDLERWPPEKQHNLFNKIKDMNNKAYAELVSRTRNMNGHSLDMLNLVTSITWKQLINAKDKYTLQLVLDEPCMCALFLDDSTFNSWAMEHAKDLSEEIKKKYDVD